MDVRFIADIMILTKDSAEDRRLFVGALGLPLTGDDDYVFSEKLNGSKHFAVWSLTAASQAFFGTDSWPADRPVPQAMVEFEVNDVAAAAQELQGQGYELLHPPQDHPWNQTAARLQNKDGLIVGVCFTPLLRDDAPSEA
jgi:catechol 2,3-dioxygenase-like lactoylglutathione lyase family enzyme